MRTGRRPKQQPARPHHLKRANFAFIDSQNLNLGIRELGWRLDHAKFRTYLTDKYQVGIAYLFLGFLPENQDLYRSLQQAGYVLIFKPTFKRTDGIVKGNVDAELVLQAMIDLEHYDQAVIVTSDGDFACLVVYLRQQQKLRTVLSPNRAKCSVLLRRAAQDTINYLNDLRGKLALSPTKKHR